LKAATDTASRRPGHGTDHEKNVGNQSYVVEEGDTLYSIARKFYNSPKRWRDIRDANKKKLAGGTKLQPGETITIP